MSPQQFKKLKPGTLLYNGHKVWLYPDKGDNCKILPEKSTIMYLKKSASGRWWCILWENEVGWIHFNEWALRYYRIMLQQ